MSIRPGGSCVSSRGPEPPTDRRSRRVSGGRARAETRGTLHPRREPVPVSLAPRVGTGVGSMHSLLRSRTAPTRVPPSGARSALPFPRARPRAGSWSAARNARNWTTSRSSGTPRAAHPRARSGPRHRAHLGTFPVSSEVHDARFVQPLPALPRPALVPRGRRRQQDGPAVPALPQARPGSARDVLDGGPFTAHGASETERPIASDRQRTRITRRSKGRHSTRI